MKKKHWCKLLSCLLIAATLSSFLVGAVPRSGLDMLAVSESLFYRGDIDTNWESYLDSSAAYKLPDAVGENEEISLIVQVKAPSLLEAYQAADSDKSFSEFALGASAQAIRADAEQEKAALLAELDRAAVRYRTGADYAAVLSGFELLIMAKDFEQVCRIFGERATVIVGEVYRLAEPQRVSDGELSETGILDSSSLSYDGSGMVVALLGTGIDPAHTAFSTAYFTADRNRLGLTQEEISSLFSATRAAESKSQPAAADVYVSAKLPFCFDYAEGNFDVFSGISDHGTHVAGIIAGNDQTIRGVAPNAQLVVMKTYSDASIARTAWILSALDDCALLGVDVINLSLGNDCGYSRSTDQKAIDKIFAGVRDAGISLIAAASNKTASLYATQEDGTQRSASRPDDATISSFGAFDAVLSVASAKTLTDSSLSDFSAWGPTAGLEIKPEMTAPGEAILSATSEQSYERRSGPDAASANLSGAVTLLRQYVCEAFEEIAADPVAVSAHVNRLMMSTTDILMDSVGIPCAVRRQGAGLINLAYAMKSPAYLLTYDPKDGSVMDSAKVALGDDPLRTGVYTLTFSICNFSSEPLTYTPGVYVCAEGVNKETNENGETTVTGEGYGLLGTSLSLVSYTDCSISSVGVTVEPGDTATLTVTLTLSDADKAYLDASFANGTYVEGYLLLTAAGGTDVDLSFPYLAFYGDWSDSPLFESAENGVYPVGGLSQDYVALLGSYYFQQDPSLPEISASKEHIAISNQSSAIHSLQFVCAELLRNADGIEITVVEDSTGEVIFQRNEEHLNRTLGKEDAGASVVNIDFAALEQGLNNNAKYTVKLSGYLILGGEKRTLDSFEFPLTVDFSAPAVTDCSFYSLYDQETQKLRLYAKVAIYDNHYAMASQMGYVTKDGNLLQLHALGQYMTPVESSFNSTTYVVYELTDVIDEIRSKSHSKNSFTLVCYDYAMNYAAYEIPLPDDFGTPAVGGEETLQGYFEGRGDDTLEELEIPEGVTSIAPYEYANYTKLKKVTLPSTLESIGEGAFQGCTALTEITVNVPKISAHAFRDCENLKELTLGKKVAVIEEYAFCGTAVERISVDPENPFFKVPTGKSYLTDFEGDTLVLVFPTVAGAFVLQETSLTSVGVAAFSANPKITSVEMPYVTTLGAYALAGCTAVERVTLAESLSQIPEYAFYGCQSLKAFDLSRVLEVGAYAFANTAITQVDLSSARLVGDHAFLKSARADVSLTLGEHLEFMGDNPFAMCNISLPSELAGEAFCILNGGLYRKVPRGLELICYAGKEKTARIAEGTVRISARAFAGTDVKNVMLSASLQAIGHKAFYACTDLSVVSFTSYHAPILEEEYDPAYFAEGTHIPATGSYAFFSESGVPQGEKSGTGLLSYYMWNAPNLPSNLYYGATFADYVGAVKESIVAVRPVNGEGYASFVLGQYFEVEIDGAAAADAVTLEAIAAIDRLPESIATDDEALVRAAREAYERIATAEMKALVDNYNKLLQAEKALEELLNPPAEMPEEQDTSADENKGGLPPSVTLLLLIVGVLIVAGVPTGTLLLLRKRKPLPSSAPMVEFYEDSDKDDPAET